MTYGRRLAARSKVGGSVLAVDDSARVGYRCSCAACDLTVERRVSGPLRMCPILPHWAIQGGDGQRRLPSGSQPFTDRAPGAGEGIGVAAGGI